MPRPRAVGRPQVASLCKCFPTVLVPPQVRLSLFQALEEIKVNEGGSTEAGT